MDMKKLLLALAALTVLGTASAYSYSCNTYCFWVGNQQFCNQNCY
jgi:hypothetical protein